MLMDDFLPPVTGSNLVHLQTPHCSVSNASFLVLILGPRTGLVLRTSHRLKKYSLGRYIILPTTYTTRTNTYTAMAHSKIELFDLLSSRRPA